MKLNELPKIVREYRLKQNLSAERLAAKSNTTRRTICNIEGGMMPTTKVCERVLDALGLEVQISPKS